MFRLKYYSCLNAIGYMSGMGKKRFELDLSDKVDRDVFVVVGANAVGKSVFLSTIHPWNWPTDNRKRFIAPHKEGELIRDYIDDDGTVIRTKCLYHPKKDSDDHTVSCYLEIRKPGADPVEMNPTGNATSYQRLLHDYFGISKDFITFSSYSNQVASIVRLNHSDRKSSIGEMVPNMKRYENVYDVLNTKYKNLRTLLKNLSQKILSLRDEDSLESDYRRVSKDLKEYTEKRESVMRKLSVIDGRIRELTGDRDVDDLIREYNRKLNDLNAMVGVETTMVRRLFKLYDKLGLTTVDGHIICEEVDEIPGMIMRYERKLASFDVQSKGYKARLAQLEDERNSIENDMAETESALYGVETQDPKELEKTLRSYEDTLADLRYTTRKKEFEGMSYDEAIALSKSIVVIDQMVRNLYDEYGQMLTDHFANLASKDENVELDLERLRFTIESTTAKRTEVYQKLIEKQQYLKFRDVLSKRPSNCHIDSCPFIAEALKFENIGAEIDELQRQYAEMGIELDTREKERDALNIRVAMGVHVERLTSFIESNYEQIQKYLGVSMEEINRSIANGTWDSVLSIMKLKEIASILSEKELYNEIINVRIPSVKSAIEVAKVRGTNREILEHQLERLKINLVTVQDQLVEQHIHYGVADAQVERYSNRLRMLKDLDETLNAYRKYVRDKAEATDLVNSQVDNIKRIRELEDERTELKSKLKYCESSIKELSPLREKLYIDLDAIRRMKLEKLEIERDFVVVDVIRRIVAPGKGIRKELIGMFMEEVRTTANQLLLNTFGGKLYLEEFLVTDTEFTIPYSFNGSSGIDICYASSAQQSIITTALNMALLVNMITNYGIYCGDEMDNALNPTNKAEFLPAMIRNFKMIGICQAFIITQSPQYYVPWDATIIAFPGAEIDKEDMDNVIEIE